ncbi:MAG: T9SS type A sorting domain-containing protein [Mariniphaga sp.]|nr:T9SS type A sorting domain-containing protein [Mariniphaga sp.]
MYRSFILTKIILLIAACNVFAQYQVPLYAPGNSAGMFLNNNSVALSVTGQNAIGISENNTNKAYFGLLAPLALITDAELINSSNSRLMQNYPNPFRKFTTIPFEMAKQSKVKLIVTDIMGRPVEILLNQVMPQGSHNILYNADGITPGLYLYYLELEDIRLVKTMVITK